MYLTYKIFTSRNKSQVKLEKNFSDSIMELDRYFFDFTISVLSNNKKVAILKGTIFDNDLIENDDKTIDDIADSIDGDVEGAISMLYNETNYAVFGEVCYIDRFYILPNFRQKGIGSYLLSNLRDILRFLFDAKIEFFTTFISPHNYIDKKWIENDDKKMKKLMTSLFVKYGFKEIGNSGNYAKIC